jgi:hypothetical protein
VIPQLIGYFPKRTTKRPDWLAAAGVDEIASVSSCISAGPDDWIQLWLHNRWGFYDSPEIALKAVPTALRSEFDLFAYELYPAVFDTGDERPLAIPPSDAVGLDDSFVSLGYDVVSRSTGDFFECSPLSCNGMAEEVAVNSHCLLADLEAALELARRCDGAGCEPGPYYVMRVWRRNR